MEKVTFEQFEQALKIVNQYKSQIENEHFLMNQMIQDLPKFANAKKEMKICELPISTRTLNILRMNKDKLRFKKSFWNITVNDLGSISKNEFRKCRNAGKESLKELTDLCAFANVEMKH